MSRFLRSPVRVIDDCVARATLSIVRERPALITLLFHSLFLDAAEADAAPLDPQQRITVAQFVAIIEYFQAKGHRFIRPDDLLAGLKAGEKHVMLTFDDGYYNNLRALDVLDRLAVPATFFISTGHVIERKCFWWDVLRRELRSEGAGAARIAKEGRRLKSLTAEAIEDELVSRFGRDSLIPRSDVDRPLAVDELRALSRHPRACLGNHTRDHAILTNYDAAGIDLQIESAQADLADIAGAAPKMIAYPNGNVSEGVIARARAAGLTMGITTRASKNRLPLDMSDPRAMQLFRFTPWGDRDISTQCESFRSDYSLSAALQGVVGSVK